MFILSKPGFSKKLISQSMKHKQMLLRCFRPNSLFKVNHIHALTRLLYHSLTKSRRYACRCTLNTDDRRTFCLPISMKSLCFCLECSCEWICFDDIISLSKPAIACFSNQQHLSARNRTNSTVEEKCSFMRRSHDERKRSFQFQFL